MSDHTPDRTDVANLEGGVDEANKALRKRIAVARACGFRTIPVVVDELEAMADSTDALLAVARAFHRMTAPLWIPTDDRKSGA